MEKEKNGISTLLKDFTEHYLRDGDFEADFSSLSPKERVGNLVKLLPYCISKETGNEERGGNYEEMRKSVFLPSLFPELQ